MSGKKDDIIKALLNVAAFPYEGKVPQSIQRHRRQVICHGRTGVVGQ